VIDHIYVENVVHAFLLMERNLAPGSRTSGRAYFVTNYSPATGSERYLDFNTRFASHFGRRFHLAPAPVMTALASAAQAAVRLTRGRASRLLGPLAMLRPASLTLARATYYFTHRRAEEDFGYTPLYAVDEAMAITAEHWHRANLPGAGRKSS
jgi:nucleoside-diphosphate-sugar epimerase